MGNRQQAARTALHLSTSLGIVAGIVLLAIAIWTLKDKAFLEELLRSRLYMDATYIILVVSVVLTILSCFGCFAARKETALSGMGKVLEALRQVSAEEAEARRGALRRVWRRRHRWWELCSREPC